MGRRARAALALALAFAGGTAGGCGGSADSGPPTLNWYTFEEPSGAFAAAVKRCNEAASGRYEIEIVPLPTDASQQRELLVRRLAAEDSDIDIAAMDVIWTAEFAEAEWVLPWEGERKTQAEEGTLEGPLETARYKNELFGAPLNSNTQLLWYRKDRVDKPPATWDEMIDQAEKIGDDGKIQVQAARYEVYTAWFNTLVESAGGTIVTPDAEISLGAPAVRAAEVIARLGDSSAADPAMSNNKEDEGRLAFQSGASSFMVNYPFVYPSAKEEAPDVFKNMGVAVYPRVDPDKPSRVTLGGINLGVTRFSKNPDLAFEAAICLRQPENQIVNAQKGGLPPTTESLYEAPEIKKAYPGFATILRDSIDNGVPRPVTPAYSDISLAIQETLHPPEAVDPQAAIDALRDRLDAVKDGGIY